jgi:hypothetical protein
VDAGVVDIEEDKKAGTEKVTHTHTNGGGGRHRLADGQIYG